MPATTYPNFNERTDGAEVAAAFSDKIRGKTVLITGVNIKGLGFAAAEVLAAHSPACIIVTGRNKTKNKQSTDALKAKAPSVDYRSLQLDLSSQKNVRAAAAELMSWNDVPAIDIVVNNAGIMNLPERTMNEDGIEMQFATNHVGHFLFNCLIMPKLLKSAQKSSKGETRIVNITSLSPSWAAIRWSDMAYEKVNKTLPAAEQPSYDVHRAFGAKDPENLSYLPLEGYNQSKVANLLFSIASNKRLYEKYGILSLAVHPGAIHTELRRNASKETSDAIDKLLATNLYYIKTVAEGVSTGTVAALDPKLEDGIEMEGKQNWGVYLADCQISDKATPLAESSEEAERLWRLSEELVKQKFAW